MVKLVSGSFTKLDLRDYWEREDTHFTPWLAEDNNMSLLGDAIEMELEVQDQESRVGPFRADILCRNTSDDSLVLIENQLEKTDHTHLGQLLTYASGLNAVTLIWIVQSFTEEHRAVLDWLNRITDDKFHFFGLEIELWSINGSDAAPKFNVVAKPNDWSKKVKEATDNVRSKRTPWQQTILEIWGAFGTYLDANKLEQKGHWFKPPKPSTSHWMGYGVGKSGIRLIVSFTKKDITVQIEIDNSTHPNFFSILQAQQKEIEEALDFKLSWEKRDNIKFDCLKVKQDMDMTHSENWLNAFAWMTSKMVVMDATFRPIIKELSD